MASTCITCVAAAIDPEKVTFDDAAEYYLHQQTEHGAPAKKVSSSTTVKSRGNRKAKAAGPLSRSPRESQRRAPRAARIKAKDKK